MTELDFEGPSHIAQLGLTGIWSDYIRAVIIDVFVFGSLHIVVDQYGAMIGLAVKTDQQFRVVSVADERRIRDNV